MERESTYSLFLLCAISLSSHFLIYDKMGKMYSLPKKYVRKWSVHIIYDIVAAYEKKN